MSPICYLPLCIFITVSEYLLTFSTGNELQRRKNHYEEDHMKNLKSWRNLCNASLCLNEVRTTLFITI
jgi:hypothetical protein